MTPSAHAIWMHFLRASGDLLDTLPPASLGQAKNALRKLAIAMDAAGAEYVDSAFSFTISDDGTVSMEWCKENKRIGLFFDTTVSDSSWSCVSLDGDGVLESGEIDGFDADECVKVMVTALGEKKVRE